MFIVILGKNRFFDQYTYNRIIQMKIEKRAFVSRCLVKKVSSAQSCCTVLIVSQEWINNDAPPGR